jgi:hypothetical protein
MPEVITVTVPAEIKQALDDFVRKEGLPTDEVVGQAIREHLFVRQFRSLRERMAAKARSQGIAKDEDVFDRVS